MNKKLCIGKIITHIILIFVTLVTVLPILFVISGSFKSNMELMMEPSAFFPKEPTIQNFIDVWNSESFNVPVMLKNSIYFTVCSVVITLLTSALYGYVFARGDFKLKNVIFVVFSAMMFVNFGSITIYPIFEVLNIFDLSTSINGLLVMRLLGINIANVFLVRGYVKDLPRSLDESAEIDGCGFVGIFFRILLPLLKPIMATLTILAFKGSWNEYIMPTLFTIGRPDQHTLIVGLMELKNSEAAASSWNLMFAGTIISLIPVLVVYVFCNRYFIEGLTAGAVKG